MTRSPNYARCFARFLLIVALAASSSSVRRALAQTTPPDPTRTSPFPAGKRGFCFKNSCNEPIRPGQIGAATGIRCGDGCPAGTVCNPNNNWCHFNFNMAKVGILPANSDRVCVEFDALSVPTRVYPKSGMEIINMSWNGAIYASTGCRPDGVCDSGLCKDCTTYVGFNGPTTYAELTVIKELRDTYSVKVMDGANLPLVVKPLSPDGSFVKSRYGVAVYQCGEPGTVQPRNGEKPSTWAFQPKGAVGGAVKYAMVNMSTKPCSSGCGDGETCGLAMKRGETGYPTNEVLESVCGRLTGVWSDNAVCRWTDAVAYSYCKTSIPKSELGGTYQQAFGCWGPFEQSCQAVDARAGCCGCAKWEELGLPTEASNPCKAVSEGWKQEVEPRVTFLKEACPTCYAYPFDEATSLFHCRGPNSADNFISYEFEWCQAGTQLSVVTHGETLPPTVTSAPTQKLTTPPTTWPGEADSAAASVTGAAVVASSAAAAVLVALLAGALQ